MIDVEIEDDAWLEALPEAASVVDRAVSATLRATGAQGADVAVLLTDDETVRAMNRDFRGKDQPTNVLSFPAAPTAAPHLGDVALAYETCAREAAARNTPLEHHLTHLVAHGALHLLGWDHQSDAEAEAMESVERKILAELGMPDPYAVEFDTDVGPLQ
jgi:probable rRNA maturation factor